MPPNPKLFNEDMKHPKGGSTPLTEERIEKRGTEVDKWNLNESRTRGKIAKMCTGSVHEQLKDTWTAKGMWDNLKSKYTADGWCSKW